MLGLERHSELYCLRKGDPTRRRLEQFYATNSVVASWTASI